MAIAIDTYKLLRGHGLAVLERHQHTDGYIAVVLSGGYEEAGDRGCFRVQAGDVICHEAFEAHLNRYDSAGADLIVLRIASALSWIVFTLEHIATWGWSHVLIAGFGGLLLTLLYVWRRNLWINIIAHFVVDGASVLLA